MEADYSLRMEAEPTREEAAASPAWEAVLASGPSNHSACTTWVPDLPVLPHEALSLNLLLYLLLLLLVLVLILSSCSSSRRRPGSVKQRGCAFGCQSLLTLLFAADRVGWAALLFIVMKENSHNTHRHPFSKLDERLAFVSNRLGSVVFFILTGLLLVEVGDVIVVGWKTSRRLWLCFKLVAAMLCAAALALAVAGPWLDPPHFISFASTLTSCASGLAALAIAAIALRYSSMEAPAVLRRFGRARCAIRSVWLLTLACFAQHAIPTDSLAELLEHFGLCDGDDGGAHLAWIMLLHSHWLAELVPCAALLLLTHGLQRLEFDTMTRCSDSLSDVS